MSSPGEQERNADGHKSGGHYVAVLFGLQLPLTHNPFKYSERYILLKDCVTHLCCVVVMILHESADGYTTKVVELRCNGRGHYHRVQNPHHNCGCNLSESKNTADRVKDHHRVSPSVSINHCFWQVFQATSCILTGLL